MFRFIRKCFFVGSLFLSNLVSTTSLSCISMNNEVCKARPEIINVNSNNPIFYSFSIKTSKQSGNCNNINDPYTKICAPDVVKDLNAKVFNLMSRTNEIRHIKRHEICKCICRLDAIVCNNKQRWNNDKCRWEYKELLIKAYVVRDIFGILVIVNANVINHVMLVSIQIIKIVNVQKGWQINQQKNVMKILKKQVQLKLFRQSANIIIAYYTLCYFQYFLQSMLELLLILFTINI